MKTLLTLSLLFLMSVGGDLQAQTSEGDGKFVFSSEDSSYSFIDKNAHKVKKLGKWSIAYQFDHDGFAKV